MDNCNFDSGPSGIEPFGSRFNDSCEQQQGPVQRTPPGCRLGPNDVGPGPAHGLGAPAAASSGESAQPLEGAQDTAQRRTRPNVLFKPDLRRPPGEPHARQKSSGR